MEAHMYSGWSFNLSSAAICNKKQLIGAVDSRDRSIFPLIYVCIPHILTQSTPQLQIQVWWSWCFQRFDLIIFTFYSRRTMRALVLLNQAVTFDWKLLNFETIPFTVLFMLANIYSTSLNYSFDTYSVLSSWAIPFFYLFWFIVGFIGRSSTFLGGFFDVRMN